MKHTNKVTLCIFGLSQILSSCVFVQFVYCLVTPFCFCFLKPCSLMCQSACPSLVCFPSSLSSLSSYPNTMRIYTHIYRVFCEFVQRMRTLHQQLNLQPGSMELKWVVVQFIDTYIYGSVFNGVRVSLNLWCKNNNINNNDIKTSQKKRRRCHSYSHRQV